MSKAELVATAQAMMQAGKGILAMDESNSTCNNRLEGIGVPQTVESRTGGN